MEAGFKLLAAAFIATAAFFLWSGNRDGVFVTLVLAAVSFLLSMRFQIKKRLKARQTAADDVFDEGEV